jgi:hypothetical protein
MEIKEHLKTILGSLAEDARVEVDESSSGRVDALVISGSFAGVPDRVRQENIWTRLRDEMSAAELLKVSFVLATTPEEEKALSQWPTEDD